jgi:hypothetical protein
MWRQRQVSWPETKYGKRSLVWIDGFQILHVRRRVNVMVGPVQMMKVLMNRRGRCVASLSCHAEATLAWS